MIDTAAYGRALFALAAETGTDARIREELELVRTALRQNVGYVTLLDTPAVATEEKLGLLRKAFDGMEQILLNFLSLLCEKRSIYLFCACADAYDVQFDTAHDVLRATAVTAVPMQERQCHELTHKLEKLTGKHVSLSNRVDQSVIGGITLRYGGVQLDDSIRSRLDKLLRSLSDTIV